MSSLTDEALDRAIDEAARQLTDAEPRAGFRRRVLGRLESPRPRWTFASGADGRRSPGLLWAGGSFALAAMLLAIFMYGGARREHVDPPATARVESPAAPSTSLGAAGSSSQPSTAGAADITPMPRVDSRADRRVPRMAVNDGAAPDIEPLTSPPIDVTSIAIDRLKPGPSIAIAQLEPIPPIRVAPLDADEQGDPR
jgi:hypothetical protein